MPEHPTFPAPEIIATIVVNPFVLARTCGPGLDLDDVLELDDSFAEFDGLLHEHGHEVDDDDDELVTSCISLPLYLRRGWIWEIELYDNGEDSGVVHRLWPADAGDAITIATIDAHPTGPALDWSDAERLFTALAGDERNRATHVAALAPLLVWPALARAEHDAPERMHARLAQAWTDSGAVDAATAERLAADSVKRRKPRIDIPRIEALLAAIA